MKNNRSTAAVVHANHPDGVNVAQNNFKKFIQQITPITNDDFTFAMKSFKDRRLKKGQYFLEAGKVCDQIAYVNKGILRTFYLNDQGEEITYCFCTDHHLESAFKSFIQQSPSTLSIQALEDTELLTINYNDLQRLYHQSKAWERIGRILSEKEYLKMEEHASNINNESAKEKYLRLLREHPLIIQKSPLHYISSYLGITPRHLSRLRKEISGHLSRRN